MVSVNKKHLSGYKNPYLVCIMLPMMNLPPLFFSYKLKSNHLFNSSSLIAGPSGSQITEIFPGCHAPTSCDNVFIDTQVPSALILSQKARSYHLYHFL